MTVISLSLLRPGASDQHDPLADTSLAQLLVDKIPHTTPDLVSPERMYHCTLYPQSSIHIVQ